MKLVAFVGSPRKGSNTDILIDRVIEGAKSKTDVEVEKIYLYEANIQYCSACGAHTVLQGKKDCPIKDDMEGILKRMQESDAFIFGSPNHGHTISAAMTNFISRMMPMLNMEVERDASGKIINAKVQPLIRDKKVVMVVSQGDFAPSSSALILRIFDSNFRDFQLRKVGEVFSTDNFGKAWVKDKQHDLDLAFSVGQRLAMV